MKGNLRLNGRVLWSRGFNWRMPKLCSYWLIDMNTLGNLNGWVNSPVFPVDSGHLCSNRIVEVGRLLDTPKSFVWLQPNSPPGIQTQSEFFSLFILGLLRIKRWWETMCFHYLVVFLTMRTYWTLKSRVLKLFLTSLISFQSVLGVVPRKFLQQVDRSQRGRFSETRFDHFSWRLVGSIVPWIRKDSCVFHSLKIFFSFVYCRFIVYHGGCQPKSRKVSIGFLYWYPLSTTFWPTSNFLTKRNFINTPPRSPSRAFDK